MEGKRGMEREGRVEGPLPQVTATALCIPTPCCALHKVLGLAGIAPGVGVLCVDQQVSIQAAEVLLTSCTHGTHASGPQAPHGLRNEGQEEPQAHSPFLNPILLLASLFPDTGWGLASSRLSCALRALAACISF